MDKWELVEVNKLNFVWSNKCKRCCMLCVEQFLCSNICVKECIECDECLYVR